MTLGYSEFTPPKKFSEHALLEFENFDFWRFMRCSPEYNFFLINLKSKHDESIREDRGGITSQTEAIHQRILQLHY